ncbi:hypothetical protein BLAT2472_90067 [Burkholderia latens]
MAVPSFARRCCAAARSRRARVARDSLDGIIYFGLLTNARGHAILFADMARNPHDFSA